MEMDGGSLELMGERLEMVEGAPDDALSACYREARTLHR